MTYEEQVILEGKKLQLKILKNQLKFLETFPDEELEKELREKIEKLEKEIHDLDPDSQN